MYLTYPQPLAGIRDLWRTWKKDKKQRISRPLSLLWFVTLSILNCTMLHHAPVRITAARPFYAVLCVVVWLHASAAHIRVVGAGVKNTLYSLCHPFDRIGGVLSLGFCGTRWCLISAKPLAQWRRLSRVSSTHGFGCENRPNMDIVVVATFQD